MRKEREEGQGQKLNSPSGSYNELSTKSLSALMVILFGRNANSIQTPLKQTMPTSGLLTVKCHQRNPNVYIAIVKFALDRISKV